MTCDGFTVVKDEMKPSTARLNRSRPWRSTGNLAVAGGSASTAKSSGKPRKRQGSTSNAQPKDDMDEKKEEAIDVIENGELVESQGRSRQSSQPGSKVGSAAPSRPESQTATNPPSRPESKQASRPASKASAEGSKPPSETGSRPSRTPSAAAASVSRKSTAVAREVTRLDADSAEIQLGSHDVVVRIPTQYRDSWDPNERATLPEEGANFDLEWIYGYRGKTSSSNIELLSTGEMAYFVANVVVLYNPDSHTQRHYRGHTSEVSSLTSHKGDSSLCASGQSEAHQGPAHVQVWNFDSLETLYTIGMDTIELGISALEFIGDKIAIVDQAEKPVITLWKLEGGEDPVMVSKEIGASSKILSMVKLQDESQDFFTTGHGNVSVWTVGDDDSLSRDKGLFTRKIPRPEEVTCSTIAKSGEVLTGDSDGNVMIWNRVKVVRVLKGAHQGPVGDICVMPDGSFVSGGLKDAALVFFNGDYQLIGAGAALPTNMGNVNVIRNKRFVVDEDNGSRVYHLIIGTTSNCIIEASMKIEKDSTKVFDLEFETIVQGHSGEITDVAKIPEHDGNPGQFLTSSKEGTVIKWDGIAHKAIWTIIVDSDGVSTLDVESNGNSFAVGASSGKVYVSSLESPDFTPCLDVEDPIDVVKYSPDGNLIAIAAHDNGIHVVEKFEGDYRLAFYVTGHSSHVIHIDWTSDSKFLRSNSGDYELLFWSVDTQEQVVKEDELDNLTDWSTQSCTISFETLGLWTRVADGTDINVCDADFQSSIIASGDDNGKVNIMRYPAVATKSEINSLQAHSSHVKGVQFLAGSQWLVSAGGREASIAQWNKKT